MAKYVSFYVGNLRKIGVVEGNYVYEVSEIGEDKERGNSYKLNEINLDIPIQPLAIICTLVNSPKMVGVNNKNEAREMVKSPKFFIKLPTVAIAHRQPIISPPDAIRPEVEIGIITRLKMKDINRSDVKKYILGYTVFNDITYPPGLKEDSYYAMRRDPTDGNVKKLLMRGTHFRNKVRDTFAPMGPYIVTEEEIGDVNSLRMRSYYNGELVQDGYSSEFIFSIEEILVELSKIVTIPPFSVVSTGSIGYTNVSDASEFTLKPIENALMVAEVEKIGRLENPIKIYQ
ncbi:fumarylacetoacetate (FAA) hydrolase [Sulfolobus islandicus L.S.2.15]|jgi:2-keto-4-pentenoate hydratase/2-oxohepta-3-ene-1,7-dioic acid hydratase in catechol pathway|uniref:Fumarylacetoacetate (FAA) hydrolase n=2 Tax=Saccharolobus islandicus TaxID=43080 RepID=C3MLD0_SACI2|nr:fumarylacetoacetate hydrolase family protein [Sulfolobus islandicus]ACP36532.1 fumarylacetoacetate (FAA) hydrolase [Sulfolobus islandicus L.S.2.15]ADB88326.1 fumarylacetoacetate (FAA) hydrolase [Sulfolobus islandicus L.D.8.5]